jgi:hypothetical protein
MRGDDGGARRLDGGERRRAGGVRDVDHHPEIVRAGDSGAAERTQALMLAAFVIRLVGKLLLRLRAVGEIVVAIVNEAEIARAEIIVEIEQGGFARNRIAVLDADQRDAFLLFMKAADIGGGEREADLILVLNIRHAADGGELGQRLRGRFRIAEGAPLGLRDIDDEEDGIETAVAHPRQVDLHGPGVAERRVVFLRTEEARNVDMRVDGDDALMDARGDFLGRRRGRLRLARGAKRPQGRKDDQHRHGSDAVSRRVHAHGRSPPHQRLREKPNGNPGGGKRHGKRIAANAAARRFVCGCRNGVRERSFSPRAGHGQKRGTTT